MTTGKGITPRRKDAKEKRMTCRATWFAVGQIQPQSSQRSAEKRAVSAFLCVLCGSSCRLRTGRLLEYRLQPALPDNQARAQPEGWTPAFSRHLSILDHRAQKKLFVVDAASCRVGQRHSAFTLPDRPPADFDRLSRDVGSSSVGL